MKKRLPDKTYSIQQAADYLGVSSKTLRRWEVRGLIASLRTAGNQRRFELQELDRVKQSRTDHPFAIDSKLTHPQITSSNVYLKRAALSISEAAEFLGVTPRTIRRWE